MCLFVEVSPCDVNANVSRVKRVLKAASGLSAFPGQARGRPSFALQNNPHCACDLLSLRGHGAGGVLELNEGGRRALEEVAEAMTEAGIVPFEFRVFWADARVRDTVDLALEEFRAVARANSFDSGTVYRICGHEPPEK